MERFQGQSQIHSSQGRTLLLSLTQNVATPPPHLSGLAHLHTFPFQ